MLQAAVENIAGIQVRDIEGYGDALVINSLRENDAKSHPPSCFAESHRSHYAVGQRCPREQWQLWAEPRETGSSLEPQAGMLDKHPSLPPSGWANPVRALCPSWASNFSLHLSPKGSPRQPQGPGHSQRCLGWRFLISGGCLDCVHGCTFIYPKEFY